jgi:hypothetical protein
MQLKEKNTMTREEIVKSMSVQDAIQVLQDTNTYGTADIAKSVVIDIMCKYQKIQEIINNAKDSDGAVKYNWLYEQIKEVLDNGNDEQR